MKQKNRLAAGVLAILLSIGIIGSIVCEQIKGRGRDKSMDGWQQYTIYWFDVFDTVTRVVGYAPSQNEWTLQMNALHEDLLHYHKLYDIYNTYPDATSLAELNEQAAIAPAAADPDVLNMLAYAAEMNKLTEGKMNAAMGSVLLLWHEARDTGIADPEKAALPDEDALKTAAEHMDPDDVILDPSAGTLFYRDPLLRLDVGSVGKGYAVEQAALAAEERGLKSAFISVGGNLRAIGHKPDGVCWTGALENALAPESAICGVPVPEGCSLVTSGDYMRYYVVNGERYCHLIDPDTLYPARQFASVSVLCSDSGMADCLSTGLFCLSQEEGAALVKGLENVEACWQLPDGTVIYTEGFPHTKLN